MRRELIGLFGGTFDPIHIGHVKSARELKKRLQLDQLRLLPCHRPPHRDVPGGSSDQRLAMVKLAIADEPTLDVDDRELRRSELSYTVDTLLQIRGEVGEESSLCLIMGMDAFAGLHLWHRWEELLGLAHIVVMDRPGASMPEEKTLVRLLQQQQITGISSLAEKAAGYIFLTTLTQYPVSATDVRRALKVGDPVDRLLSPAVLSYIKHHQLYS